uniref:FHA domain-containing protein n=1 Tax=Leptobrachium leishanense TaxID=445787 RepID=A0A8C5WG54_9ANUR
MPRFGEIIVIKRNGSDGTHFPLTATTCLFGRQAECDIRIQLPHVSKEHCRVEVKGNKEIFVTNLSTVNPAQLNGKAIQQPVRLTHGDVLTIIDRSFRFEEAGSKPVRRRSTGLGSDTYQELQNEKFSSIDETVELESSKFFKKSRKSEGVISKTTHTRRSLQITSSKDVARSWADIVKIGVAKPQKKNDKPALKAKITKKKKAIKTPLKKAKALSSTGHADSPATILIGRAHTRSVNITGHAPKVIRNPAAKINIDQDESFTGMAQLFSTPVSTNQRRSVRKASNDTGTPRSAVYEMSVVKTPEESGEMVVSPMNSLLTTQRKKYSQEAVSRLLRSPVSLELLKDQEEGNTGSTVTHSEATAHKPEEAESYSNKGKRSKTPKEKRKTMNLTGIKRLMKTPKQRGTPITDPVALKKMLRTPTFVESLPVANTRRSAKLDDLVGVKNLMKTPKQKGEPVLGFMGIQRIVKTPRQKGEPVEDLTGIKRIMRTPKQKGEPVEDMVGIKRIMTTPKEKSQSLEDMEGVSRLMSTPTENTHPIEEIFGIRQLIKTPPKKTAVVKEVLGIANHTPTGSIESTELVRTKSKTLSLGSERGISTKRLSENVEIQKLHEHVPSGEMNTPQPRKRGRPSKTTGSSVEKRTQGALNNAEKLAKVSNSQTLATTKRRSRSSTNVEIHEHLPAGGEMKTTQPQKRGRPSKSTGLSADKNTQKALNDTHNVQETKVSDAETEPSTRRSRSSSNAEKQTLHEPVVSADGEMKTTQAQKRGRPSKSTGLSADKNTQKALNDTHNVQETKVSDAETEPSTRRSRSSSNAEKQTLHEPVVSADGEMKTTQAQKRGRPSKSTGLSADKNTQNALNDTHNVQETKVSDAETEPSTRRSRSSSNAEKQTLYEPVVSADGEMKTTQAQKRGRPSKSTGLSADKNTQKALNDTHNVQETKVSDAETEPSTRRSRSSSNTEKQTLHEPVVSADGEMKTTQAQKRGRPSKSTGLSADNNTQKALNDTHNVQETVKVSSAETEPATRRSRSSSNSEKQTLHEPVVSADGEMKTTQAQKRGRPSKSTGLSADKNTQKALNVSDAETEPSTRRSRSSSNAEKQTLHEPVVSADGEMKTTPPRKRGRPSKNTELPAENSTQKALNAQYVQEQAQVTNAETETSKRRSRSTTNVTQVPGTSLPEVNKPAQESKTVGSTKPRQARGKLSGNVKESLEQNDVNVKSPPAKRRGRPVKDILPESLGNKATEQPASPPSKSGSAGSKSPKKTWRQSKNVQIETQESKVLVNQEPENSVPKRKGRFTKSSVKDVIPSEQLPQDHQDNSAVTVSSRSSNRKTAKSHNIPKRITHATANQQSIQSSRETHLKVSLQENVELQVVESVKQTELGKHTASKTRSRRNVQTAGAAENLPVTEPEQSKDEPAPVEKAVGRRTVRNKSLQVANEQSSVSEVVNLSTTQPEESTEKPPVEKAIVRAGRRKNIEEVIEQLSGLKGNLKSAQGRVFKTTSATEAKKSQSAEEEQPALTKSRRQKGHTAVNLQTKKSRANTAENAGESAGVQHLENSSATSESAPIESPVKSTNVTQPARRGRFAKVKDVVPAPEAEVNESKRLSDFASKVVVLEETSSSIVISKNVKGRRKDQSKGGTFLVSKSESTTVEHVESTKTINKRSMRGKKDLPPAEDLHTDADATLRQSRRAKQILQPLDGERGLNQKSSKNRAVQWRTPVANQGTSSESRESSHTQPETSSKVSARGKSKESAEELIVPSKRSRRNAGVEENGTTDTERPSEEAKVSPAKSGKKVAKKQTQNVAVPVVVDGDILKPKGRGRGAVSKSLVQENNEVAGSTLPKRRGRRAAVQAPSQDVVISPHKTVDKDVLENADPVDRIPKSRRAVKRKANSTEPADEGSVVSAKTSKKPAVLEESPAKKNKTEGTTSSTQKSGKHKSASKSENKKAVQETTARTTRASARTRK